MRFQSLEHTTIRPSNYSTAMEYFLAAKEENNASANIDKGNEPYLIDLDALDLDLYAYVTVEDVGIALKGGKVLLFTTLNTYEVDPGTLLVWR